MKRSMPVAKPQKKPPHSRRNPRRSQLQSPFLRRLFLFKQQARQLRFSQKSPGCRCSKVYQLFTINFQPIYMAEITATLVAELRERTGAGMMDCKKALTEAKGDVQAAVGILRVK